MINHYDIAYGLGVGLASPYWLAKPSARRKIFRAFSQRMGHSVGRDLSKRAVMIHAVSLGEINATRALVEMLRKNRPELQFIVSVTTETGFARGKELYGSATDVTLVRYPLDFTSAIDRLLLALRPDVVALMELEVWPNFIQRCASRGVPVLLINGRITPVSFKKYKLFRPVLGAMFRRLDRVCVQEESYAKRFVELGVRPERLSVIGTMKFDNAAIADRIDGQDQLAADLGLAPGKELIWVCGSTGPGEEKIVLDVYRKVLGKFPGLRLVVVPRKPERFDEMAALIEAEGFGVVRRSQVTKNPHPNPLPEYMERGKNPVVLGDTMGELKKFYAIADVVFVGRSLVDLGDKQHGSDMIEPAAIGKPVIVGPFTGNFAEPMSEFVKRDAMVVVSDADGLAAAVERTLASPDEAKQMANRARDVVRQGQGATARHAEIILQTLDRVIGAGERR